MKKVLLYIWQLPQNLLALILIGVYSILWGKPEKAEFKGLQYRWFNKWYCGVSLGNYVLLGNVFTDSIETICHEWGHSQQSVMLGPLYLLIIGLPSAIGNLIDRWFHTGKNGWDWYQSYKWYYSQPWEKWADKLGGVDRHFI